MLWWKDPMSSSTISTGTFKMAGLPWFAMVCGVALLLGFAMADVPYIVGLEDGTGMGYPTSSSRRASISQPCHGTKLVYIYNYLM